MGLPPDLVLKKSRAGGWRARFPRENCPDSQCARALQCKSHSQTPDFRPEKPARPFWIDGKAKRGGQESHNKPGSLPNPTRYGRQRLGAGHMLQPRSQHRERESGAANIPARAGQPPDLLLPPVDLNRKCCRDEAAIAASVEKRHHTQVPNHMLYLAGIFHCRDSNGKVPLGID